MKMTPKVSVVTSAYNHAWCLEEAIRSVLNQTFQDFEFIVTDDGSSDGTRELLKPYQRDSRIRCFFEAHGGASLARNKSFEKARGNYIAILDADDVWFEDKLERQAAFLDRHPGIDLVHGFVEVMNSRGQALPRETSKLRGLYKAAQKRGEDYTGLSKGVVIFSSSVLVRKECLDRTGHLDPELEWMQDLDLYLRIALKGGRIGFLGGPPVARYRYRGHAGHTNPSYLRSYLQVFRKHLTLLHREGLLETHRAAYRNLLLRMIDCHYALNELEKCRECSLRALQFDPRTFFNLRLIRNLLFSFFPPQTVTGLREIKNYFINGLSL